MTASWPKASRRWIDAEAERQFALFQSIVTAIRNVKAELNVPVEARPAIQLSAPRPEVRALLESQRPFLQALAQVGEVALGETITRSRDAAAAVVDGVEILMPLAGLIDAAKERQRIQARLQELSAELTRIDGQLGNAQFIERAPSDVVEQVRGKRAQVLEAREKFTGHLRLLETL